MAWLSAAILSARRGWEPLPETLTIGGSLLLALGAGLTLLPPRFRGVAGVARPDRQRQAVAACVEAISLALLTAMTALAILAPQPWTVLDAALATLSLAMLVVLPAGLSISWHSGAAGLLVAAGWHFSRVGI